MALACLYGVSWMQFCSCERVDGGVTRFDGTARLVDRQLSSVCPALVSGLTRGVCSVLSALCSGLVCTYLADFD